MAAVELPALPGPATVTWHLIDAGGLLTPPLGGDVQRLNRLGTRWAVEVQLPPLAPADAMRWAADLTLGRQNGVRWKLREIDVARSPVGAPLVAGAGQSGFSIAIDGMTPGASWQKGKFLAVTTAGRSRLYQTAVAGAADGAGAAAIAITTPLRKAPADNDAVSFAPSIEGLIGGDAWNWTVDAARLGRMAFLIMEAS